MINKIPQKIIEKALELMTLMDRDELIYGESFVEFGERKIEVLNPETVRIKHKKNGRKK